MAYVKLDCGMLDSTLWIDRCARELFITALLMAEPVELTEPMRQIKVREIVETDFEVPPGWYGFVHAASTGIIHRCMMDQESGMSALERLGEPESESRSPEFEGRRMVRVNGGWIILNFDKYRKKDHTAAERSKRYRERLAQESTNSSDTSRVTSRSSRVSTRSVTQAEAEAEVQADKKGSTPFNPPSVVEGLAYAKEIGWSQKEFEGWYDHFQSNGWKVGGKAPMKDWKAAMRNGARRHAPNAGFVERKMSAFEVRERIGAVNDQINRLYRSDKEANRDEMDKLKATKSQLEKSLVT